MSSARYKRDIRAMGNSSEALMKLRLPTPRYNNHPQGHRQYGLVAEEVTRMYPELVIHDADGEVVSVHYRELVPMFLNKIQKVSAKASKDEAERASFEQRLSAERTSFEQRVSALEHTLTVRDRKQTLAADLER